MKQVTIHLEDAEFSALEIWAHNNCRTVRLQAESAVVYMLHWEQYLSSYKGRRRHDSEVAQEFNQLLKKKDSVPVDAPATKEVDTAAPPAVG